MFSHYIYFMFSVALKNELLSLLFYFGFYRDLGEDLVKAVRTNMGRIFYMGRNRIFWECFIEMLVLLALYLRDASWRVLRYRLIKYVYLQE